MESTPTPSKNHEGHELSSSQNKSQASMGSGPLSWPRRLYDWTLSWADHPYGFAALCILSMIEAIFFPIPPDVLLIALVLGAREQWFRLACGCTLASMIGGIMGYGLGLWAAGSSLMTYFYYIPGFTPEKFQAIKAMYDQYDFWVVFTAGFTPIPFKVITVSAGVWEINFVIFIIASVISRGARFFLVAWLLRCYGEPIREFIERRFNILTLAFTILLIGGFLLLKVV